MAAVVDNRKFILGTRQVSPDCSPRLRKDTASKTAFTGKENGTSDKSDEV